MSKIEMKRITEIKEALKSLQVKKKTRLPQDKYTDLMNFNISS